MRTRLRPVSIKQGVLTLLFLQRCNVGAIVLGFILVISAGNSSDACALNSIARQDKVHFQPEIFPFHDWDAVAQCESGGRWHIISGNGYYGGLQFKLTTWHSYGGVGNPAMAPKSYQILVAERVLAHQGLGAWPVCGPRLYGLPANRLRLRLPGFHLPTLGNILSWIHI